MEENKNYTNQFDDSDDSGFDIKEWLFLILHYWWLFLLGATIALGLSYLKNRTWIESYKSTGTIILNEGRPNNAQIFMQGFGTQTSNLDNQLAMLSSYDFISRVVDSLPNLKTDYISKGRFKVRNLYNYSPIQITSEYVDSKAYGILFRIDLRPDGTYTITEENDVLDNKFAIEGKLGEPIQHYLFFLTVNKTTTQIPEHTVYFRLRSKESLIHEFMPRIGLDFNPPNSSVLKISLVSQTPDRDKDFINKMSEVYITENLEKKNEVATKTINFIDNQLDTVSVDLSKSESALTQFRKNNQIVDLSTHSSNILGKASQYDEMQSQLRLRKQYLHYLKNYFKTNLDAGSIIAPSSMGLTEPMLMSLVAQFNEVVSKKNETNENSPLYSKYVRELKNIKNSFNEVIKSMEASIRIEEEDLNKKLASVNQDISKLPGKEMEMIGIERKYRVDDNYYTFFLQKRAEAAIQKASNSPDSYILDKARIVALTNGNTKSRTILIYLLFGLLIPLIFIVLKEILNNTIRDPRDVEKLSPFPLIGAIRHAKNGDPLLAANKPRSSFAEMYRVIRTRIEFIVQRKSNISILITSAESGDGKTYFSTNLASVYAMTGMKTLLIDMDIRKPSIHDKLGLEETEGFTNYLINERSLEELIIRRDGVHFDILLAGTVPPNPGELIRSEKLKNLLNELKQTYDYIIVDTSPIGLVADAYSLAPMMDVNLMIARSDKTNKGFFKRINEQLKLDKMEHFYVILNDMDITGVGYGKYGIKNYGYGYGYGYGRKQGDNQYTQYYTDDEV